MNNVVYKYPLLPEFSQELQLPIGAKILHVAEQNGVITLWAHVDSNAAKITRRVMMRGTGDPAASFNPEVHAFAGTVLLQGGALVLHVWIERYGIEGCFYR